MGRLKLTIAGETSFMGRLADCIQKNGPEYLEISRCREMGQFTEFLANVQPDILLCEQETAMQEKTPGHTVKILLADTTDKKTEEYPVIFRYQRGTEILRQIFQVYEKVSERDLVYWYKTEDLQMTAIYAPGGHEFQLPFSVAYAALCGQQEKVLYLNLAEFSGMMQLLGDEEGENISDFIYGIRQKRKNFSLLLQSMLHHAEYFDYVQPPGNPTDLYEFQEEDLANLLSLLTEQTEYQRVIWNLGTLHTWNRQVLKHCDRIFCVVRENSFGMYRKMDLEHFLEKEAEKELQQKVRYVSPQFGSGGFVQGVNMFMQLQSGEFAEQVRGMTQES